MIKTLLTLSVFLIATSAYAGPIAPTSKRSKVVDFALKDLKGKTHKITDYRGKVVVVSLWATWCKPCLRELKFLKKLKAQHPDKLEILAVATDSSNTASRIRPVAKRSKLTMPVLLDGDSTVLNALNSQGSLPHSTYVDAQGRVAYAHSGFIAGDEATIEKVITQLLGEK